MPEIGTSGSMSGDGKRGAAEWPKLPRPSSTLPHAWLMLGHCAGLRNTQKLGDYVLAHGYVREDHVLDEEPPVWVPIPALAEMQVALEQAVGEVTGLPGFGAEAHQAHWNRCERGQSELGDRRPCHHPALVTVARYRPGHGVGGDRRKRLSFPRALWDPPLRLR
jgi:nucleoside phosphorylase